MKRVSLRESQIAKANIPRRWLGDVAPNCSYSFNTLSVSQCVW